MTKLLAKLYAAAKAGDGAARAALADALLESGESDFVARQVAEMTGCPTAPRQKSLGRLLSACRRAEGRYRAAADRARNGKVRLTQGQREVLRQVGEVLGPAGMRTTEELFAQVGVHHATPACLDYCQDQGREYFRQKLRRLARAGLLLRVGLRWRLGPMVGGPTGQRELF
jgi:hypothetical protein